MDIYNQDLTKLCFSDVQVDCARLVSEANYCAGIFHGLVNACKVLEANGLKQTEAGQHVFEVLSSWADSYANRVGETFPDEFPKSKIELLSNSLEIADFIWDQVQCEYNPENEVPIFAH